MSSKLSNQNEESIENRTEFNPKWSLKQNQDKGLK